MRLDHQDNGSDVVTHRLQCYHHLDAVHCTFTTVVPLTVLANLFIKPERRRYTDRLHRWRDLSSWATPLAFVILLTTCKLMPTYSNLTLNNNNTGENSRGS